MHQRRKLEKNDSRNLPVGGVPEAKNRHFQAKWVLGQGSKDIYLQPSERLKKLNPFLKQIEFNAWQGE